jgi:hypothetical protein
MAMLLAMYQKMRLIREKNQATLDLTKFSSKYDRVSKNIEKVQKMYTSKIASLESQAKMMMSSAKSIFQQGAGLMMDSNYLNPTGYGAMNGFIVSRMQELVNGGQFGYKEDEGKLAFGLTSQDGYSSYNFQTPYTTLYEIYTRGMLNSGKANPDNEGYITIEGYGDISQQDIAAFQALLGGVQGEFTQRTMAVNQMNSNYETNVSIWLEAAKAQLEAQQDEAVEPLTYQQTMWELEKEQAEQRLERIKAELEYYTRLCSEEAKEQAPKFGLG